MASSAQWRFGIFAVADGNQVKKKPLNKLSTFILSHFNDYLSFILISLLVFDGNKTHNAYLYIGLLCKT